MREAGVEAFYAYIGGRTLEEKIGHLPFTAPLLRKRPDPLSFMKSVLSLRRFIRDQKIDIVHAHLSHDHMMSHAAAGSRATMVRTFHSRRTLRTDPFHRWLATSCGAVCVNNSSFAAAPALHGLRVTFTPPPLKLEQFTPDGPSAREAIGVDRGTPLIGYIGKVSPGRGFEEAILTFAALRRQLPAKMMIIGRGPHQPYLEQLAASLGVTEHVKWVGYHEDDLADYYRAADVMLFTAPGSDQGHRAVLEELGCGVPVASFPIEGVSTLLGDLAGDCLAAEPSPSRLAEVTAAILTRREELAKRAAARAQEFGYRRAAERLLEAYAPLKSRA